MISKFFVEILFYLWFIEIFSQRNEEKRKRDEEKKKAEDEKKRLEEEKQKEEEEKRRKEEKVKSQFVNYFIKKEISNSQTSEKVKIA